MKFVTDQYLSMTRDDLQEEIDVSFGDVDGGVYKKIFNEETIGDGVKASKYKKGISRGGLELPFKHNIGEKSRTSSIINGYEYLIEYEYFRLAVEIYDMDVNNSITELSKELTDVKGELQKTFEKKVEIMAFDFINNGDTNVGPDGKPLFSATHPIKKNVFNTDTTWSNLNTSAEFNTDNFYNAYVNLKSGQRSLSGDKQVIIPKMILIPDTLIPEANQFAASEKVMENNNNAITSFRKGMEIVPCPRLTDNATRLHGTWYLSGDKASNGLYIVWRIKPTFIIVRDDDAKMTKTIMEMYVGVGSKHPYGMVRNEA